MLRIPKFELVSTNPEREGTEDYRRKNFDKELFYRPQSQKLVIEPSKNQDLDPTLIINLGPKLDKVKQLLKTFSSGSFSDIALNKLIDEEIGVISAEQPVSSSKDEDDVEEYEQGEVGHKETVLTS